MRRASWATARMKEPRCRWWSARGQMDACASGAACGGGECRLCCSHETMRTHLDGCLAGCQRLPASRRAARGGAAWGEAGEAGGGVRSVRGDRPASRPWRGRIWARQPERPGQTAPDPPRIRPTANEIVSWISVFIPPTALSIVHTVRSRANPRLSRTKRPPPGRCRNRCDPRASSPHPHQADQTANAGAGYRRHHRTGAPKATGL